MLEASTLLLGLFPSAGILHTYLVLAGGLRPMQLQVEQRLQRRLCEAGVYFSPLGLRPSQPDAVLPAQKEAGPHQGGGGKKCLTTASV